jgi:cytochrome b
MFSVRGSRIMNATTQVKVWDPLVRVFHWSLVFFFFIAYFTEDDLLKLHVWAGYAVLALVLWRLLWGVVGTAHARFTDFVFRPAAVISYLKDVVALRARRYLGHNPAGGAMIIALLVALLLATVSGLAAYGADQGAGPLATWMSGIGETGEDVLEDIHEFFANLTLILVFAHVAGVLVSSVLHHENLPRAMVTGYKRAE